MSRERRVREVRRSELSRASGGVGMKDFPTKRSHSGMKTSKPFDTKALETAEMAFG